MNAPLGRFRSSGIDEGPSRDDCGKRARGDATMSRVAHKRVAPVTRAGVLQTLRAALDLVAPSEATIGDDVLVKLNAMSDELFPGRNTSPWVLEATLACLRDRYPRAKLTVVDTDVAGTRQLARACKVWGYDEIAARFGAPIRNLSSMLTVRVRTPNPNIPELDLPQAVVEASAVVNVPVLKTHVLTGITCALKNHWGLLPRVRYQFHPIVSEMIAEINRQIPQTSLTIVDGTVCIEGNGPKIGTPRVANVLLAGQDRVAVDAAALELIGMPIDMARHVTRAAELGVGTTDFEIVGDPMTPMPFERPRQSKDVVSWLETRIRNLPVIGRAFYWPPIAGVLGQVGTQYNKIVWMNLHGRKHLASIRRHPEHGPQFNELGA
jgi:uncharacterized protein (DUF362 family)